MNKGIVLAALVLGLPSVSHALVCTLATTASNGRVIIAKPGKSSEMFSLLKAGENMEAMRCCLACLANAGARVVITDQGFVSHTVRVIDGEHQGCAGDVPREQVTDCQ